jgi:DNA-binding winged helix-turn-helix (wHTH) protein
MRYRFADFMLSPQRRLLVREGREVPLIPRYFDLLLLLIEQRQIAVQRREIFDRVWAGVIVSESALSQAVRTLRRTLGDDPREPRFIRTVSRHGYQFVFPDVIEEADDAAWPAVSGTATAPAAVASEPLGIDAELAAPRWTAAAAGGALAGLAAGGLGGLILAAAPGSTAPLALAPVLAVIGAGCGALGGAGVGAGLALADAAAYSPRALALTFGAAIGGGLVGAAVQWLTRWALAALVGLDVAVGGGPEGLFIGAAAGLGYAIATRNMLIGEPALPRPQRLGAAAVTAILCGLAGLSLTLTGRPLAGGTIHAIASAAHGSQATLAPLGRLIGEPDFGPVTGAILAFGEAAMFGLGVAVGLLRRVR